MATGPAGAIKTSGGVASSHRKSNGRRLSATGVESLGRAIENPRATVEMEKIIRGSGVTASERYLHRLSDGTFLKLWTYPNTFSDRNKRGGGDGKEICDLLVVCSNDVLVFSDKSIEWPDGATNEIRWSRWYRRAIKKSVDQIRGAERWLRDFQNRVFLDGASTRRLPVELPPPETRRVHGIAIVRGARRACSSHFGDSDGSLCVLSALQGDDHLDVTAPLWLPFSVGDVNPGGPFVHVFDEAALDSVMREMYTVTDFTAYLGARANAIRSGDLMLCANESDLLAYYMQTWDPRAPPNFIRAHAEAQRERRPVMLWPGAYADFVASGEYARKKAADTPSYFWDRVIGEFVHDVMDGSTPSVMGVTPSASLAERALRIMAREDRLRRRMLGAALEGTLAEARIRSDHRFARLALPGPESPGVDVGYVFMALAFTSEFENEGGYARYREVRAALLETYCMAALFENRGLKQVVGVAADKPGSTRSMPEELIAVAVDEWTPELVRDLSERRAEYGILDPKTMVHRRVTDSEYPPVPGGHFNRQQRRAAERRAAQDAHSKGNFR